jgi:dolichyl-phosphate beta-glucosyltransferase
VQLSIVIPAYQEQERLGPSLEAITRYLQRRPEPSEILVVDDGSTDKTSDVAASFEHVRVLRQPTNRGKGAAVRRGVAESRGQRVLMCDADLSTPIEEVEKLEELLGQGADLVLGSRGIAGSDVQVAQAWYRERLGRGFNLLLRLLGLGDFRDTQCGFKLFDGEVARSLFPVLVLDGFAFDVELLDLAKRRGLDIREVGVIWINSADSRVDPVRDSLRMLRDVVRLRLRRVRRT